MIAQMPTGIGSKPRQNLRRGFNRIFIVLAVGWSAYWLFVAPVFMAREASVHYDRDVKDCYEEYGPAGIFANDKQGLAICLAESHRELATGLYAGFTFPWKEGEFWSYRGYWRGEWGSLS